MPKNISMIVHYFLRLNPNRVPKTKTEHLSTIRRTERISFRQSSTMSLLHFLIGNAMTIKSTTTSDSGWNYLQENLYFAHIFIRLEIFYWRLHQWFVWHWNDDELEEIGISMEEIFMYFFSNAIIRSMMDHRSHRNKV